MIFHWKSKTNHGYLSAPSKHAARILLLEQKTHHHSLKKIIALTPFNNKTKLVLQFFQQMSLLLEAGVDLITSFSLLLKQKHGVLITITLQHILTQLNKGYRLSTALQHFPELFNNTIVASIQAAEQHGQLETSFKQIAQQLQKTQEIKSHLIKKLTYPLITIIVSIIIIGAMLLWVIPQFSALYQQFDTELPPLTQVMLSLSKNSLHYSTFGLYALVVIVTGERTLSKKNHHYLTKKHQLICRAPILGKIIVYHHLLQAVNTISLCYQSGIAIDQCFKYGLSTMNNLHIRRGWQKTIEHIQSGKSLSVSLEHNTFIPHTVNALLSTGEQSGQLDKSLKNCAYYLSAELNTRLEVITQSIEPAVICILATLIGSIVIAMYLPIMQLGDLF